MQRRSRSVLTGVIVFVVVLGLGVGAGAARLEATRPPLLRHLTVQATRVTFPGAPPVLDWPADGEAAVSVEGVGNLGSSGGDQPVPIASLAKVMTAYLTLQDHPLRVGQAGFTVEITPAEAQTEEAMEAQGQSTVDVTAGEKLDEYQLLEALLVPSANNAAAILADEDAGSQAKFVADMNAEAHRLGMDHTTYTDPSGYRPTTVSTAADQLRLAKLALGQPVLARIVALPSVVLPVAGVVRNFNPLAGHPGDVGIKTGSDSQAGGCLDFAFRQRIAGHRLTVIGVVLGQDRGVEQTSTILQAAAKATTGLVDSVTAAVRVAVVVPAGRPVVRFTNAEGDRVRAVTRSPLSQLGWGGLRLRVTVGPVASRRSLRAGTRIATVSLSGRLPARTVARARATMPTLPFRWRLHHIV
ncbi:MAG TPA: hypothetical protein VKV06_17115 [Acidimicrobiales bacterium]|nr:hypothetical protein [Acidimicrobiales bacterium]